MTGEPGKGEETPDEEPNQPKAETPEDDTPSDADHSEADPQGADEEPPQDTETATSEAGEDAPEPSDPLEMLKGLAEDPDPSIIPPVPRRPKPPRTIHGRLSRAAMAGQAFEAWITDPIGLDEVEPYGAEEHGLTLDYDRKTAQWRVSGLLDAPGIYEIILVARIGTEDVAVTLRLNVSPDPWSIWKDLPVDWSDLPYKKDDVTSEQIQGDLTLTTASRRGRSHAHKALPRDDDARIRFDPVTHWHIGAVADGAGSAPFSRKGSEIAVQTVEDALPQLLERHAGADEADREAGLKTALHHAAFLASQAIDTFAKAEDHPRRDFSTTLLIGVIQKLPEGGWLVASFSVGDGAIALLQDNENPLMISADSGAFAGQTVFLETPVLEAEDSADTRFHMRETDDFTAFLLATDGISDAWFPSDAAMADPANWAELWGTEIAPACAAGPDELAEWLNFKVKGEHDDRTLVIMTPPNNQSLE